MDVSSETSISAAILCKNASSTLTKTLDSLTWVDEIIILDDFSSDNSIDIAKKYHANVFQESHNSFAEKRNALLARIKTDWVLFIDADEVIPNLLQEEIKKTIFSAKDGAYFLKRTNYFLGRKMMEDKVQRLFHQSSIKEWVGKVHESPIVIGQTSELKHSLLHYTHRDITSMLSKTNDWSEIEAELRLQAHHPPVSWWRLLRIALTIAWQQFIQKNLLTYGRSGLFEGYFQIVDKLIIYTKLWEKQHISNV